MEAQKVRDEIERRLAAHPSLARRSSRHGDSFSYFVGEREIIHFHGRERMDVRLTSGRIPELTSSGLLDPRVTVRGRFAQWVAVRIRDDADVAYALELAEEAIHANS